MTTKFARKTEGHVRHYLATYIPEDMASLAIIGKGVIFYNKKPFAAFRYFDGFDEPLFRFVDMSMFQQRIVRRKGRKPQAAFRMTLGVYGTPSLVFDEGVFTPELQLLVRAMAAGKPSVTVSPELVVDFWDGMLTAKEFLHELNENYVVPESNHSEERRSYRANWLHKEIRYIGPNEDTFAVKVRKNSEMTINGTVDVVGDRLRRFHFEDGGSYEFDVNNSGVAQRIGEGN